MSETHNISAAAVKNWVHMRKWCFNPLELASQVGLPCLDSLGLARGVRNIPFNVDKLRKAPSDSRKALLDFLQQTNQVISNATLNVSFLLTFL